MREKKYHLYLTADEQSKVIQSLIDLKNNLIAQGRYTDAVDDVLLKVLSAMQIHRKGHQGLLEPLRQRSRHHGCLDLV